MIDFRYHLVSIVAIFLALAVGVVLGTTTLNGPVLNQVQADARQLRANNQNLHRELAEARARGEQSDRFLTTVEGQLVGGKLAGQPVALVSAAEVPKELHDLAVATLGKAGATVVSDVTIKAEWADEQQSEVLDGVVSRIVQPGVALPSGSATGRAAAVLAAALLDRPARASVSGPDTTALAALREAGFVTVTGRVARPASLAVLLVPGVPAPGATGSPGPSPSASAARPLVALARALDAAGSGAVMAGPPSAAGPGGAVWELRRDEAALRSVSSVDVADIAAGRVAIVNALAGQLHGAVGQYGAGPGANALVGGVAPKPGA